MRLWLKVGRRCGDGDLGCGDVRLGTQGLGIREAGYIAEKWEKVTM